MKTLLQIKDEVSVEHGYDNWDHLQAIEDDGFDVGWLYDAVAKAYAEQAIKQYRDRLIKSQLNNDFDVMSAFNEIGGKART